MDLRKHYLSGGLRTGTPFYTREECPPRICTELFRRRRESPRSLSLFKHDPWIVFANEPGTTYLSPSGKNEMRPVNYMDAFLVIKRKGDWLQLIQYDPAILKNGRLKEWKQARYCGWINPGQPVADPKRCDRHSYGLQEQAGGDAGRQCGTG